ncbi:MULTISPECIES: hypothetical protein [Pectobacterium]|uniref:hypothetical protein n=1 Tax=Pectobacterium TaxID=122277 RepID=UPI000503DFC9|nr:MULTISPECIES: hypothetical protein [Pectobacterium]KFX11035.1 hypothetical protein JV34_21565 [Pectobacterium atrosepticum]KMK87590.1 hypothetical protein KCQ_05101 [Pectobacterium atrosepticum ICMP 1526]QHP82763.1 hypothetical protein EO763_22970 [Pectobacterium odoriferum]QXE13120.1 hypothetical protein DCX48_00600 [Pectobacterium atrosepticum]
MNYEGHEKLRADVAALANAMSDMRTKLNVLESRYRFDADSLTERLAAQCLRQINAQFYGAFHEALSLDQNFND